MDINATMTHGRRDPIFDLHPLTVAKRRRKAVPVTLVLRAEVDYVHKPGLGIGIIQRVEAGRGQGPDVPVRVFDHIQDAPESLKHVTKTNDVLVIKRVIRAVKKLSRHGVRVSIATADEYDMIMKKARTMARQKGSKACEARYQHDAYRLISKGKSRRADKMRQTKEDGRSSHTISEKVNSEMILPVTPGLRGPTLTMFSAAQELCCAGTGIGNLRISQRIPV
nr:hypothetical protein CFP56_21648 [Quercus suber]